MMAQNDDIREDPIKEEMLDEAPQSDAAASGESAAQQDGEIQRELFELKARLLRWQADFQNLQRRAAREVLESRQNADADFAKAMLHVLDHFDMALGVDPDKVDARTVLEGVRITYDELRKVLSSKGIEPYDPTGLPFDPHWHEAVMQESSEQHAPMTVIETFQQGYRIGDRVLRPAKVKVSK